MILFLYLIDFVKFTKQFSFSLKSDGMKKLLPFFILIVCSNLCFAQFTSNDNYIGNWTDFNSWTTSVPPLTGINSDVTIAINGEITANTSVEFLSGTLSVNGTLVIEGNLALGEGADLSISNDGVLLVLGNLSSVKHVSIEANGILMIYGDYEFMIPNGKGIGDSGFTSDDEIAQVYIGGKVILPNANKIDDNFPVLEEKTGEHESTGASYGDILDLSKELPEVFDSYKEIICGAGIDPGSIGSAQSFCGEGNPDKLTELTASTENLFQWFFSTTSVDSSNGDWEEVLGATGKSYDPPLLDETTSYYREVHKGNGCVKNSEAVTITIDDAPAPVGIFHD